MNVILTLNETMGVISNDSQVGALAMFKAWSMIIYLLAFICLALIILIPIILDKIKTKS